MTEGEESSAKKEEELFGIPVSKLGLPALAVGGLALAAAAAIGYQVFRPNLEAMQNQQRHAQQQAMLAQQQQYQAQQAYQHNPYLQTQEGPPVPSEAQQAPVQDPNYAVEQDPFQRQPRRARIPEVEGGIDGNGSDGSNRFNSISV